VYLFTPGADDFVMLRLLVSNVPASVGGLVAIMANICIGAATVIVSFFLAIEGLK
jgi:hypothetical protein